MSSSIKKWSELVPGSMCLTTTVCHMQIYVLEKRLRSTNSFYDVDLVLHAADKSMKLEHFVSVKNDAYCYSATIQDNVMTANPPIDTPRGAPRGGR